MAGNTTEIVFPVEKQRLAFAASETFSECPFRHPRESGDLVTL
jgi:hypothetical protein